jgi:hypothetical protein
MSVEDLQLSVKKYNENRQISITESQSSTKFPSSAFTESHNSAELSPKIPEPLARRDNLTLDSLQIDSEFVTNSLELIEKLEEKLKQVHQRIALEEKKKETLSRLSLLYSRYSDSKSNDEELANKATSLSPPFLALFILFSSHSSTSLLFRFFPFVG